MLLSRLLFAGLSDGLNKNTEHFDLVRDIDSVLPMEVQEQRMSGLIQSLLVAVCLREPPSPLPRLPPLPLTCHDCLSSYM